MSAPRLRLRLLSAGRPTSLRRPLSTVGVMKWWAARKYRGAVDEWLAEYEAREALLSRATKAARGIYGDREFRPESDERLVDAFDSELLAMRRVRVTNYGSASHRTASHNTYRVGQARSEGHDELRSIDRGRVIVTDRRIVYLGRRTEEVRWHRMLNLTDDERRGVVTCTVGNRKTPVMIRVPRNQRRELGFAVSVGLDLHDGTRTGCLTTLRRPSPRSGTVRRKHPTVSHPTRVPSVRPQRRHRRCGAHLANSPPRRPRRRRSRRTEPGFRLDTSFTRRHSGSRSLPAHSVCASRLPNGPATLGRPSPNCRHCRQPDPTRSPSSSPPDPKSSSPIGCIRRNRKSRSWSTTHRSTG